MCALCTLLTAHVYYISHIRGPRPSDRGSTANMLDQQA